VETIHLALGTEAPTPSHNTVATRVGTLLIHAAGGVVVAIAISALEATVAIHSILRIPVLCVWVRRSLSLSSLALT
jgi:hypothetical protein